MADLNESAKQHLFSNDLSGLSVLIADRHSASRDAFRIMLSNLGITRVIGAGSSQEVLRQAKSSTFDLILSDYLLEDGRDGQQLLEELRLLRLIPLSTVFIIVTSERSYRNVVGIAELTPDDYLIKPFTADQLQTRLARALHRKSELARILRNMDAGSYNKALDACEGVVAAGGSYLLDALRLKGEILMALGRHDAAEEIYRDILTMRPLPWASMGLAVALRAKGQLEAAESLARDLIKEHRHFLAAHDFLAAVLEQSGKLNEAQEALTVAADISPFNTGRQRVVGDVAVRTGDLETAERAYQTALRRSRGSSISTVDDYANLSRVLIAEGKYVQARGVAADLRREKRTEPASEFTAHVIDSLAAQSAGNPQEATHALERALTAHEQVMGSVSERLSVDLAHAALTGGQSERAHELVRQLVAENPDNSGLHQQILRAFEQAGQSDAGKELLASVNQEIQRIQADGASSAQEGDLENSVSVLTQAADRMPNLQFLLSAAHAIFSLLDRRGWVQESAERGLLYLMKAQKKDAKNPKVIQTHEFLQDVAQKYGVALSSLRQQVTDALKAGTLK